MGINYNIRIMHNYPQNDTFLDHNLKLHKMIEMHSKYDNMHTNKIFNALICNNDHVNSCANFMLSGEKFFYHRFLMLTATLDNLPK